MCVFTLSWMQCATYVSVFNARTNTQTSPPPLINTQTCHTHTHTHRVSLSTMHRFPISLHAFCLILKATSNPHPHTPVLQRPSFPSLISSSPSLLPLVSTTAPSACLWWMSALCLALRQRPGGNILSRIIIMRPRTPVFKPGTPVLSCPLIIV